MSERPDFWYTLGFAYEVTIFETEREAQTYAEAGNKESEQEYLHVFEGRFGEEFSGWVGNHE